MKNPVIFYVVIAVGLLGLAAGVYYMVKTTPPHPLREYVGLGVGAVLVIAGIVGAFMTRAKAAVAK